MDLNHLNANQAKAVTTTDGPVLVIAGAGTGKTSVLTQRIAYLISEVGVQPNRILGFTFTNKAAEEMKTRIEKVVPNSNAQWIRTYHSTCMLILREDIDKLGRSKNFSIIDDDDQLSLVKQIMKDKQLQTKVMAKKFVHIIGEIKLNDVDFSEHNYFELSRLFELPSDLDARVAHTIYDTYNQRLAAANQLDFEDLINYVHRLFKDNIEVRRKWQQRFDYVLIDEFQDTNLKQFEIIKWIVNPEHNNVFAVGDPNQTIYTWRGAYPEIFDEYVDFYKGTQIINLYQNYRSTAEILLSANNLIRNNRNNFKNELIAMNPYSADVNVFIGSYKDDEAEFICSTINDFIRQGKKYTDILILYRANYCSKLIEEKLITNQIPYVIFGSVNFYQRKEIKDIISYLKMVYKPDDLSAMRIINVPKRSIGIDTVNTVSQWATNRNLTFIQGLYEIEECNDISDAAKKKIKGFLNDIANLKTAVEQTGFAGAIATIIQQTKYIEYLEATESEIEDRKENIDELSRSIITFLDRNPSGTPIDFINEINLYTSAEKTRVKDTPSVHLMTVHMAKGKEYDTVFIFNFNEGVMPSSQALLDPHGIEEERRIAYVAMTRAINNLIITATRDNSWSTSRYRSFEPSRFLKEIKNYKMAYRKFKTISNQDLEWFNSRDEKFNESTPKIDLDEIYTNNYQFKVGDIVVHTVFGSGIVIGVNGSMIDIMFKKPHGKKTLLSTHKALKRVVS